MTQHDNDVPKLPRGKGVTLSGAQWMRIAMTATTLIALLALRGPCSEGAGRFVTSFGTPPPAGDLGGSAPDGPVATPEPAGTPGPPEVVYERLTPSMTEAETRAAIERAYRRASAATPAPAQQPPLTPGAPTPVEQPLQTEAAER